MPTGKCASVCLSVTCVGRLFAMEYGCHQRFGEPVSVLVLIPPGVDDECLVDRRAADGLDGVACPLSGQAKTEHTTLLEEPRQAVPDWYSCLAVAQPGQGRVGAAWSGGVGVSVGGPHGGRDPAAVTHRQPVVARPRADIGGAGGGRGLLEGAAPASDGRLLG